MDKFYTLEVKKMDFKHQIFALIAQFTGQNNVITINVTFVEFAGDLETGLFLSQVIYWADRVTRKDGFFYKTDDEWQKEIMLSKYSVRKARKKLEEMGLLETAVKKANGNPTVHYKFDNNRFVEMFISFLRNRKNGIANSEEPTFENEISLTEITTEITSDKKEEEETNPFKFFEQNGFGTIGGHMAEKIGKWVDELSDELVLEAMKIAVEYGAKNWNYVERILLNWSDKKITSVSQVHAELLAFRERQNRAAKPSRGTNNGKNQDAQRLADEYNLGF